MRFEIPVIGKTSGEGGILIFDDHEGILKKQYIVTYVPHRGEISTGGVPQKVRVQRVKLGGIYMNDIKRLAKAS